MKTWPVWAAACAVLLGMTGAAGAANLSKQIDGIYQAGSQGGGQWALVVRPVGGAGEGKLRFEASPSLRLIAASTGKLFVCHAAAAQLPADTSFAVTVSRRWSVRGRAAAGDVIVDGGGAPGLYSFGSGADSVRGIFDGFARAAKATGIDTLAARVWIRNDLFAAADSLGAGWQWDDLPWYYAAPVTATLLDDNAFKFQFLVHGADSVEARAGMALPAGWSVSARMRTGPAPSRVDCAPDGPRGWRFAGRIQGGDTTHSERVAIARPELYVADRLRDALERAGVRARLSQAPAFPAADSQSFVVDTVGRVPLRDVFHPILARSNNLRAEMLLRDLGARRGERGSVAEGLKCVRRDLDSLGVPAAEVRMADGSGLSRLDWVSANALARVLEDAARRAARGDSGMAHLLAGLARPGEAGSLVSRFLQRPGEAPRPDGWMLGKTGSMDGVDALAAIVTSRGGRRFVVVSLRNYFPGGRAEGRSWEESVIRAVADAE